MGPQAQDSSPCKADTPAVDGDLRDAPPLVTAADRLKLGVVLGRHIWVPGSSQRQRSSHGTPLSAGGLLPGLRASSGIRAALFWRSVQFDHVVPRAAGGRVASQLCLHRPAAMLSQSVRQKAPTARVHRRGHLRVWTRWISSRPCLPLVAPPATRAEPLGPLLLPTHVLR